MNVHGPRSRYGDKGTLFEYSITLGDENKVVGPVKVRLGNIWTTLDAECPVDVQTEFVRHAAEIGFEV